jgi:hypothetical protein
VKSLEFKVWGFRVQGLGYRVRDSGLRVCIPGYKA